MADIKFKIPNLDIKEVGKVKEVKHGIVKVDGLPSCVYGQLIQISDSTRGMVMEFGPKEVVIIALGDDSKISVGNIASSLDEVINVPVGDNFLGRVVNSLGEPLDGKGDIQPFGLFPIFNSAPSVLDRKPISESLLTGIKIVDLITPIGKGQRELIIGNRQTGKSSLGLDAIINQRNKNIVCIYCWIGGPETGLKKHLNVLRQNNALDYTIVVASSANVSAAEQYLAPYTAATLGEYFMHNGRDALVVFDDITKHAWVYRQMALLLERSPGREAYPGDIFYVHSQLMERAGKLTIQNGGGSMTFLPIVETLQGDISGYIQTNLISMTDGQIYVSDNLFREGFKPAIDIGLSVSRIGNKAQCSAIKEVSEGLRLEYAQYRNMIRLTRLRTRLSAEATDRMRRGEILEKLLKQNNYKPVTLEEEIIVFYTFKRKILEALSEEMLDKFIKGFYPYLLQNEPAFIERLKVERDLSQHIKAALDKIIIDYFKMIKEEESL